MNKQLNINSAAITSAIKKYAARPKPYLTFFDRSGTYVVCQTRKDYVEYNEQERAEKLLAL